MEVCGPPFFLRGIDFLVLQQTCTMNDDPQGRLSKAKGSATDHLANERTFLAWIRTAIAIMAFGFVVVKFALFVRQVSMVMGREQAVPSQGRSAAIGIFLVILGAVVALLAYFRYRHIEKLLESSGYFPSKRLSLVITIAIVICSLLLVWYLMPNF